MLACDRRWNSDQLKQPSVVNLSAGTLSLEMEPQFGTEGSSSKLELEDMVGAKFHSSHALADDH